MHSRSRALEDVQRAVDLVGADGGALEDVQRAVDLVGAISNRTRYMLRLGFLEKGGCVCGEGSRLQWLVRIGV